MEHKVFLERVDKYLADLQGVLSRFRKGHNSLLIGTDDQARLHQWAVELRDLFNDALGTNDYAGMVADAFNNGTSNFYGTSSYASVEQIISVVSAARTRVSDNPSLLTKKALPSSPEHKSRPLSAPQKVTLSWLFYNVPYKFWVAALGIVVASFVAGASATAKLDLVQQWFGLVCGK